VADNWYIKLQVDVEQYLGNRQGQRTDKKLQDICPEVQRGKQTRDVAAEDENIRQPPVKTLIGGRQK
jgi:hypothetical protein